MTDYTIYHNPRCSKSRQTLALLEQKGISPTVNLYLKTPPCVTTLQTCVTALGITPRALLRTQEEAYKTLNLANTELTDGDLLKAMSEHPKLIERPIVLKQTQNKLTAVLGRPPENVLTLI